MSAHFSCQVDPEQIRKRAFKPRQTEEFVKQLETKKLHKLLASDYERQILNELDGKRDSNLEYSHWLAKNEIGELSTKASGVEETDFGIYGDLADEGETTRGEVKKPYKDTFSSWIDKLEHKEWLD